MATYRIFCVTEDAHVEGESDTPLTACPNDQQHEVRQDSVTFLFDANVGLAVSPIGSLQTRGERAEASNSKWQVAATTVLYQKARPSVLMVVGSTKKGDDVGVVRLFDVTNNVTLAEIEFSGQTKTIYRGPITGLADEGDAVAEIQVKAVDGKAYLHYAGLEA